MLACMSPIYYGNICRFQPRDDTTVFREHLLHRHWRHSQATSPLLSVPFVVAQNRGGS